MRTTLDQTDHGDLQNRDEQVRSEITRRSTKIYLAIALGVAILFLLAANQAGGYPPVAKFGGMLWVGLLSLIIAMPIVTARVKKRLQQ